MYGTLAVGLSVMVYAPLLKSYFWLDDFVILNLLVNRPLGEFLTMHWAGHLVLVRNAFYVVMHALAGANPMPYYLALLALHAVNVVLVFAIVQVVTGSDPLACLAASAWGTSPLDEGALGWIAASGNVTVATTTLAVLYSALLARRVGIARAAFWIVLLLVGAESFGTGLSVAIAAPIALTWFAWARLTRGARLALLSVPLVTLAIYGPDYHEFTGHMSSSTMAKLRMLLTLQTIGTTTLLRGLSYEPAPNDFLAPAVFGEIPHRSPGPTAYLVGAVVACLWALALWRSRGRTQRLLVVLAVLVLANYVVIAVGRAYFIEAFNQPVALQASQIRYHYAATALLAIGLALVIFAAFGKRFATWAARPGLIAWLALSSILYARSDWTIRSHDGERERAARILARIDAAIRNAPEGQPVVTYNEPYRDGEFIAGAAALYVMNRDGEPRAVYFVDPTAARIYRDFPGSPLAQAVLPVPSMQLACGPWFTLQSDVR